MTIPVHEIRGMTADLAEKLQAQGIRNSQQFLDACGTSRQRAQMAAALGITPSALLEYTNRADLARIKGIGSVFGDLLEASGVDTVKELAKRRADNLHAKLQAINAEKKMAARTPTQQMVEDWINQAKALGEAVT